MVTRWMERRRERRQHDWTVLGLLGVWAAGTLVVWFLFTTDWSA